MLSAPGSRAAGRDRRAICQSARSKFRSMWWTRSKGVNMLAAVRTGRQIQGILAGSRRRRVGLPPGFVAGLNVIVKQGLFRLIGLAPRWRGCSEVFVVSGLSPVVSRGEVRKGALVSSCLPVQPRGCGVGGQKQAFSVRAMGSALRRQSWAIAFQVYGCNDWASPAPAGYDWKVGILRSYYQGSAPRGRGRAYRSLDRAWSSGFSPVLAGSDIAI